MLTVRPARLRGRRADCAGLAAGGEHARSACARRPTPPRSRALSAGAAARPAGLALCAWMGASAALLHGRGDGPRRVVRVAADSAFGARGALRAPRAAPRRAPDARAARARRARAAAAAARASTRPTSRPRARARARAGGPPRAAPRRPLLHGADDEVVPPAGEGGRGARRRVRAGSRPAATTRGARPAGARAFLAEHLLGDGPGGRREHDEEEGVLFSTDVPPWALGRAQGNDFEEVGDEEDDSPVAGFEEGGGLPRDPFATYDDADVFAAALDIDRAPDGGYGGLSFEI